MAKSTIGDITSRIRSQVKAVKQHSMLTDRLIYSIILKHSKWLMKREDSKNRLMSFSGVMQTMDFVELIEVDKVEACCTGITSDCKIKRTKDKMPIFLQGYYGPLIRTVASLDGSEEMQPTVPSSYLNLSKSKNFKYNSVSASVLLLFLEILLRTSIIFSCQSNPTIVRSVSFIIVKWSSIAYGCLNRLFTVCFVSSLNVFG